MDHHREEIEEHPVSEGEETRALRNLSALFSADFLITNKGEEVKTEDLKGKIVGLYFSAHWCPPCSTFTPVLVSVYEKIAQKGDFEIVFVSSDEDEKSFEQYHATMPWLAIPFADEDTREKLDEIFEVDAIPFLVILGKNGELLTVDGVEIVQDFEADAYPFTVERIEELKREMELAKASQSFQSLLVSDERDFLIGHGGKQIPVSELEGKTVGLFFSAHWCGPCRSLTPRLVEIYNELRSRGEPFEIVFCSGDRTPDAFEEYYATMPWLALPFADKTKKKLKNYFSITGIPSLIMLGPDGKTVCTETVDLIREYGIQAYPFTEKRTQELEAEEIARRESATLESVLASHERDFVLNHNAQKILISSLCGKTVGLYFSAHWCPPCRNFTPKLIKIYNDLKQKGEPFEVIFISFDHDGKSFEEYYSEMPWLALPFDDKQKKDIGRILEIRGIPTMIIASPDGKFISSDAVSAVSIYGAKAYPFTESRLESLKKEIDEQAEKSPNEIKIKKHEHMLVLTEKDAFSCYECDEEGARWSYCCEECAYDLHLECALEKSSEEHAHPADASPTDEHSDSQEIVCDGDVCRRTGFSGRP